MSDIIREPRLEATKFFKYQIDKNARCIHEFFKRVSASQWSLSAFVKYIAKLETGLDFEQLFKVFVESLDQICVLLVVPVCVRAFAQSYLKWLETCTGKAMVNECREYFFAKVTLQEKTELKDVFKDTVNVTAQAEAYRAYITAPAVPTKSSGTDVQERHNDKVDEELIEASKEKKRKDEDDVTVVTSTPPTKRSRSRYESSYSPSPSEVEELPSLATDNDDNYERDVPQLFDDYSEENEKPIIEDQNNVISPLHAISTISTANETEVKSTCNNNDEESSSSPPNQELEDTETIPPKIVNKPRQQTPPSFLGEIMDKYKVEINDIDELRSKFSNMWGKYRDKVIYSDNERCLFEAIQAVAHAL
ncbi:23279_t:CDS:2 [Gigaspora margarita]|uniref:23279_t:CDS:1 n=1 Tax=Gigaspora margarita TaxID=4874 RepID=A0ABN7UUA0_GIGMA|nr:23279_t:CDS:2 [Gigaspora margarita]